MLNVKNTLTGAYELKENEFDCNGDKLIIKFRKIFSKEKPKCYLWNETKSKYISSLYKTAKRYMYRFDHDGQKYLILLVKKRAIIMKFKV